MPGQVEKTPSRRRSAHWGSLTPNQKIVLPQRVSYLSLILYEYEGIERHSLAPFRWQMCNEATIEQIKGWLESGVFPNLKTSGEIIKLLGNDRIGTDNKEIIKNTSAQK